jgi:hypothetical protein
MDYGTLIGPKETAGSIRSWINYGLIDAEGVLLDAQSYIYGLLRVREMQAEATLTIAADATYVALPARFLDPLLAVYHDGYGEIVQKSPQAVQRNRVWTEDGDGTLEADRPLEYAIWDERMNFAVKSDDDYTASMLFYRRPEYLGPGAAKSTNFLTTRYPALLRRACIMFASDYRDDNERYSRAKQQLDQMIVTANIENEFVRRGSTLSE